MPYKIIPELHDSATEIVELAKKAGVQIVRVRHLYDLAPVIPAPGIVIISIDEEQLMILMRNINTLLPELPTAVGAVPDVEYSSAWNRLAATLPLVDYTELSGQLAKSGLLASTTEQAAERTISSDRRTASFASQFDKEESSPQGEWEDEDPTSGI